MTTYSYKFIDADNEWMERDGDDGSRLIFGAVETNPTYREFLESGQTAEPYVAPEPLPEPSTEEKVNRLLAEYGLTREEMQAALAVKSTKAKK